MKTTFEKLIKDWRQNHFDPVYLFYGEEDFLIAQLCQQCRKLAIEPGNEDFNLNIIYGNETDGATIVNLASSYPMMTQRRMVLVKNINQLNASSLELLLKYVKNPLSSTCLLLTAEKIDARKTIYKGLIDNSISLEAKPLYDNMVPEWLRHYAQDFNLTISDDAIRLLQGIAGNSLRQLVSEIEKIKINLQSRSHIEVHDVEVVVGCNREYTVFELCDAVGTGKVQTSVTILRHLLQHGESATGIVAMLARHFFILSRIKAMKSRKTSEEIIASELKIRIFFLKNYEKQALRISQQHINTCFQHLLEADQRLKSSYSKPQLVMEMLLFNLQIQSDRKDYGTFI